MDAGEDVVDVVLGKHDLADALEILRLMLLHPQNLGGSEPSEGDVGGEGGQLFPSHHLVEVVHLLSGAPIIPQDSRADHLVVLIQHHQAVHLAARSDARHLGLVKALQQGGDSLQHGGFPVLRVLLAPAGLRELQGILLGDFILDLALLIHQQELDGRGAKVDSNI